jgi:hypothetical protein
LTIDPADPTTILLSFREVLSQVPGARVYHVDYLVRSEAIRPIKSADGRRLFRPEDVQIILDHVTPKAKTPAGAA